MEKGKERVGGNGGGKKWKSWIELADGMRDEAT